MNGIEPWASEALRIGAGLAAGALVGIERGWKLRSEQPGTRVAGVRTFILLGLAGAIAGLIGSRGQPFVAGSIAAGATGLLIIAYSKALAARQDATSAIAALAVSRRRRCGYARICMA